MEKICIFLIAMPSIWVFAMPSSCDRDLDFVADTFTEPLKRLIAELDEKNWFLAVWQRCRLTQHIQNLSRFAIQNEANLSGPI